MERPFADERPLVRGECSPSLQDSRFIKQLVEPKLEDKREIAGQELDEVVAELSDRFGRNIGTGSGRMVFDLSDKCVLKVSKVFNSFQNKSEILGFTEKATESQKEMLAPVVDYDDDFRWLTMIKAEREPTDEEFRKAAKELVLEHGIDIIDFQKRNFGVVDGKTVLIDYGTGLGSIEAKPAFDSREEAWDGIKDELVFN